MGRRCELLPSRWWIICVVAVASAVCRPEGLSMAHSSVPSTYHSPVPSTYHSQGKEVSGHPEQLKRSESSIVPSSASFPKGPSRHSKPSPSNKPPVLPRIAPTTAFASPAVNLHGSAEPPKSITSPFHGGSGKRYDIPVAAPYSYPANNLPSKAPNVFPNYHRRHHASSQHRQGPSLSPVQAPAPSPSLSPPGSGHSPITTPGSHPPPSSAVPSPPIWLLPPPPPNSDCNFLVCAEPYTNPPAGSPCICVLPIRVQIRLRVTLYTFFPLVPEFAKEIATGINMKQNQVRIMGANVASEQSESTIVLVDLVPSDAYFDNASAFSTFEKFWHKDIVINTSLFGDYAVSYVLYPGLPPSPPRAPTNINIGDGAFGNNNNGRTIKPLGADVGKMKEKANGNLIAVIVLSSFVGLIVCLGAAWLLLLKRRHHSHLAAARLHKMPPSFAKSSGTKHVMLGNRSCSESASFGSSAATYNGSAKTFTLAEIEGATNRFDETRIIGEGGFGRVYQGTLEDGTRVAVKVLKRDDHQGGREFFSEIEMLSRLHHRNLVKLIGICIEEHGRCLVYELIPNGSVESHLHGANKETDPLDWNARMKIALGAARALAYLHEDSSPRVIHRDFKSSNILLEHDYTPKVSDFGLARTALDEGNLHISTRVMGTFGYVAPEYAMTGHLLVKSDVYSYGVVLLELLTGRKPIDMLRPSGQENLVTWARPLLTNMDNVATIMDPALGTNLPIDSVAKVAAIASMCVQPEVSHRPFMGEVVQAFKLVCNESNQNKGAGSYSQDDFSTQDATARVSNRLGTESQGMLLASSIPNRSTRFDRDESGSFQRHSSSGPLVMGKSREFWQRLRSFSTGSVSEHGAANRFGKSVDCDEEWP